MGVIGLKIEKGIANKQDPHKLGAITDWRDKNVKVLTEAQNVDIDNAGVVTLRSGRTSRVAATAPHSFWVSPLDPAVAYYVVASVLYKLNTDYTATVVTTLASNSPVCFEVINGEICLSNGVNIGWLSGTTYTPFSFDADALKDAMPAGQYIAYDVPDGALVVAAGSVLVKSEPYYAERRDTRLSEIPMNGYLRMLGWVEDGWWVATDRRVAFVKRSGDDSYTYVDVSDQPPPDGCFCQGWEDVEGGKRRFVAWVSPDGICEGRAGGQFATLADETALPTGTSGHLFRRVNNGINQYVAVIYGPEGAETYTADTLAINTLSV